MGERHKHMLAVGDDKLDVRHNAMMMCWRLLREGHMWECPGIPLTWMGNTQPSKLGPVN